MKVITISNLYPRPDQPTRGLFNFQLFREMAIAIGIQNPASSAKATEAVESRIQNAPPQQLNNSTTNNPYANICLVPEWRLWRWPGIRRWTAPDQTIDHRPSTIDLNTEGALLGSMVNGQWSMVTSSPTTYLPVFYLPLIGRSINWWFYYRALRGQTIDHRPLTIDLSGAPSIFGSMVNGLRSMVSHSLLFNVGGALRRGDYVSICASQDRRRTECASHITNNLKLTTNNAAAGGCCLLASWLYPDAVAVARLAKELGAPVWLRVHGTDRYHLANRRRRRLIMEAVDYAQGVICNCKAVADDLVERGIPASKIHIVPNGIDTELFRYRSKEEAWEQLGVRKTIDHGPLTIDLGEGETIDHRPLTIDLNTGSAPLRSKVNGQWSMVSPAEGGTILFVGNLVPIKGPDILLRAFAALGETSPSTIDHRRLTIDHRQLTIDHRPSTIDLSEAPSVLGSMVNGQWSMVSSPPSLLLIGSGPMRGQLERQARDLGIASCVHFLGNRPHAEVALWMNVADVLCLTSRSEGMPNVVREALASGLAVVATDVGGCRELLAGVMSAKVCAVDDVKGLSLALESLMATSAEERKAGSRPGDLSWESQARAVLGLLQTDDSRS